MEEKKYLSEKLYNKGKKFLLIIGIIVIIIGIALGSLLIYFGIQKKNGLSDGQQSSYELAVDNYNKELANYQAKYGEDAQKNIQTKIDTLNDDIKKLKEQKDILETKKTKLNREKSEIFTKEKGFTANYYAKVDEITAVEKEISDLDSAISEKSNELQMAKYDKNAIDSGTIPNQPVAPTKNDFVSWVTVMPYFMFGGFIIVAALMWGLSIIGVAFGREINAFRIQQHMPVVKETIDDITPTIANAGKKMTDTMAPSYGKVAEEISKGIKEGLKDEKKKDK